MNKEMYQSTIRINTQPDWRLGRPLLHVGGGCFKSSDGSLYDRDRKGTLTRRGRKQEKQWRRQGK